MCFLTDLIAVFLHVPQCILISINKYKVVLVEHRSAANVQVLCLIVDSGVCLEPLRLRYRASLQKLASNDAYSNTLLS